MRSLTFPGGAEGKDRLNGARHFEEVGGPWGTLLKEIFAVGAERARFPPEGAP